MTGRERLAGILHKRPSDRLCWTTLVDEATLRELPPDLRDMSAVDFYRHLGCDMLLLNGYQGAAARLSSPRLALPAEVQQRLTQDGDEQVAEWQTPSGTLTERRRRGRIVKHLVASLPELRVYRDAMALARFEAQDDRPAFQALSAAVGPDGVVTRFWGPSTIPNLLEYVMGIENFYYLLADHRAEVEALIALLHEQELAAFEILAHGPADIVILCENTSTHYISPEVYAQYNGPQVRDFVAAVHAAAKVAVIHMCGHVRNLLALIRETGLDGIHALTPPTVGDTPWELALDALGEDLIIIGALPPTVFTGGPVEDIGPALDQLITPRLRRANFVLCPFADGLAVPVERFRAVAAWVERNGQCSARR